MAVKKHWYPGTRQGQLDMGLLWIDVLPEEIENEKGETVKKWQAWGIPQAVFTGFGMKVAEAQEALTEAKNDEKRTKVVNQKVAAAFKTLAAVMRDIKRRYFLMPPLSGADYVSLGFIVPDTTHTASGAPTAQVAADLYLTMGRHELGVRASYLKGSPEDRENKGYEYWYTTRAPGEKAPLSPEELTRLFDTQRKNDTIPFEFGDSGKTVYVACRVKNGKLKGAWGTMISALIP